MGTLEKGLLVAENPLFIVLKVTQEVRLQYCNAKMKGFS